MTSLSVQFPIRSFLSGLSLGIVIQLGLLYSMFGTPSPQYGELFVFLSVTSAAVIGAIFRPVGGLNRLRFTPVILLSILPLGPYALSLIIPFGIPSGDTTLPDVLVHLFVSLVATGIPSFIVFEGLRHDADGNKNLIAILVGTAVGLLFLPFLFEHAALSIFIVLTVVTLAAGGVTATPSFRGNKKTSDVHVAKSPRRSIGNVSVFLLSMGIACLAWLSRQMLLDVSISSMMFHQWLIPIALVICAGGLVVSTFYNFTLRGYFIAIFPLLVAAGWMIRRTLFPEMYLSFYDGHFSTILQGEIGVALLGLPAAGVGMMLGARMTSRDHSTWFAPAGVFAGLLVVLLLPALVSPGLVLLLLIPAAVLRAFDTRKLHAGHRIARTALPLLSCVFFLLPQRYMTMFDPGRFQARGEMLSAAGRLTILQSRDYDDPFSVLMWNRTSVLTQDSRIVRSILQRMGHLPMLLHRNPQSILVLGAGSGQVLNALKLHRPSSIVCVEESAALIALLDSLARNSHAAYRTREVRFHAERPEAYMNRTAETFDVIVSGEPLATPFPRSSLFSQAHYGNVAQKLAHGGIFVQWLSIGRMSEQAVQSVVASLTVVFPQTELWIAGGDPENAMIGIVCSNQPPESWPGFLRRFDAFKGLDEMDTRLRDIGWTHWTDIVAEYGMDRSGLLRFQSTQGPFSVLGSLSEPKNRLPEHAAQVLAGLLLKRVPPGHLLAGVPDSTEAKARLAFGDRTTIFNAQMASMSGDDSIAVRILFSLYREHPWNTEVRRQLAELYVGRAAQFVSTGNYSNAITLLTDVLRLVPVNTYILRNLLISALQTGDTETAGLCLQGIKRINPAHAGVQDNRATIMAQKGEINNALMLYESAVTLDPTNEEFYCNMASVQFQVGRVWEAIRILDNAVQHSYYPAKAYYLMGVFYAERRRFELAREAFDNYLRIAIPSDPLRSDVEQRRDALPRKE